MPYPRLLAAALPLFLLIIAGFWGPPAGATRVSSMIVECPLDGTPSKVFTKVSANTQGGWDSDLCRYSSKGQWREHAISTCPEDLFSLYGDDFTEERDPTTLEALRAEAREVRSDYPDPDALQPWDRYLVAARFYRVLGKDGAFLGQLYHTASWLARDRAVGVYVGLEGPAMAKEALALGEKELEKDLITSARKTLLHNLARVAHRAGYNEDRDRYMAALEAMDLTPQERGVVEVFKRMVGEVEPGLQDMAIAEYTGFLRQPDIQHDDKVATTYLLADLLRRRDRHKEAVPLYTLVANDLKAPQQTRELAAFLLGEIIEGVRAQEDEAAP